MENKEMSKTKELSLQTAKGSVETRARRKMRRVLVMALVMAVVCCAKAL